jgi:hypothetical protein
VSGSDVIAAVALGVSGLSAGLAVVSLALSFRESNRRDEEIGHFRREGERREEELSLLRQQVEAEQAERRRQLQARIVVGTRVPASGSSSGIEYQVQVHNAGGYVATGVGVDLVGAGGQSAGAVGLGRPLVPGDSDVVRVVTPSRERYFGPYAIFVEWEDGRGRMREASGVTVNAP